MNKNMLMAALIASYGPFLAGTDSPPPVHRAREESTEHRQHREDRASRRNRERQAKRKNRRK